MNKVITVEQLSKSYILKHKKRESYVALRDVITDRAKSMLKKRSGEEFKAKEEFLALDDISFDVNKGERIGIIGRNGAGKSTLLKILSRIVTPTKGRITIEGRVASLLEVGTGFHPELTGSENIFLNGSILGMSKTEIKNKFDEIVDFSGVEKFLDTPVKRYSSGMYVRLAFAVAAHLEPEILIVDEVLAVGDSEFQKKCLGKMNEVSKSDGRTVLFVSHNMAAIQNLCNKCLYLKSGKIISTGDTKNVISEYLQLSVNDSSIQLDERRDRSGNGAIRFKSVELKNEMNNRIDALQCGRDGKICVRFKNNASRLNNFHVSVGIDDQSGQRITILSNEVTNQLFSDFTGETGTVEINLNKVPFKDGIYTFTLFSKVNGEISDWIQNAGTFQVESGDFYSTGKLPPEGQGNFFVEHSFQLVKGDD